jgi:hypothetical protein
VCWVYWKIHIQFRQVRHFSLFSWIFGFNNFLIILCLRVSLVI